MITCFCGGITKPSKYCDQFFGNRLLLCNNCGTLLIDQVPRASELRDFYNGRYSVDRHKFVSEAYLEVMRRRANAQMNLLKKHINIKGTKIVDYGCGHGVLLDALRAEGSNTYGFDYDPLCRDLLSENGHNLAENDFFENGSKWDAVCLSHVLEHLSDPLEFLTKIGDCTRTIFIEVPKYDSSIKEQFSDLEGHLWFFSEQGVSALIKQSGLCIQELISVGPSMHIFWSNSWIAQTLRRRLRSTTKDFFFNEYDKIRKNGMWIRIIATGKKT